ncbi:YcxB family protein [Streptomyces regalis]|uniref:YcxB-like C-terminal domain-containing protein n=1 Tax=Streptomyces regalis TaxID=68262 RepID=A0A117MJY8_9ACTN|nr:YcxB family protein [Streptomyces regalis]KUL21552.1 hypothetical protein ADL12_44560 [Streptomyces regalis]
MDHQGRDIIEDAGAVELAFRPTRTDFLRAIQVRDRIRRLTVLRWALTVLFAGLGLFVAAAGPDAAVFVALCLLCSVMIWGTPRLQANQAFRTVSWQGEYRSTADETGITTVTDHVTTTLRWSAFRGYRETRDHLVMLSRDPSILLVGVFPKGAADPADVDRMRTLLARHLPRV